MTNDRLGYRITGSQIVSFQLKQSFLNITQNKVLVFAGIIYAPHH